MKLAARVLGLAVAAWLGWFAMGWWQYRHARVVGRAVNTRGTCQPVIDGRLHPARP